METGDPRYTPIYKLEPMRKLWRQEHTLSGRLGKMLGRSLGPDERILPTGRSWSTTAATCAAAARWSARWHRHHLHAAETAEAFNLSGYTPDGMRNALQRTLDIGSPMGVTLKTLKATLAHVEKASGLTIPIDRQGPSTWRFSLRWKWSIFPNISERCPHFRHRRGPWTISSEAFERPMRGFRSAAGRGEREIVSRAVNAAEKLGVNYLISPECGHAYNRIRWEGPNLIGRRYRFGHPYSRTARSVAAEGRLRFNGKSDTPMTLHDPVQIVRRGGVIKAAA